MTQIPEKTFLIRKIMLTFFPFSFQKPHGIVSDEVDCATKNGAQPTTAERDSEEEEIYAELLISKMANVGMPNKRYE